MRGAIVSCLILLCASCAGMRSIDAPSAPGIPDDEIGLSKVDVTEVPSPEPVVENRSEPGARPRAARAYPGAPPLIPHGIADFVPIRRDENLCVDCHGVPEKVEGGATPIPESHYTDLRNAPQRAGDDLVGARFVCTSCHVAQTAAPPLVSSRFGR